MQLNVELDDITNSNFALEETVRQLRKIAGDGEGYGLFTRQIVTSAADQLEKLIVLHFEVEDIVLWKNYTGEYEVIGIYEDYLFLKGESGHPFVGKKDNYTHA